MAPAACCVGLQPRCISLWPRRCKSFSCWACAQVLFEGELGPLPEWGHSPCCAEFVVSKARVRSHPRRFYVDMLDWLTYSTEVRTPGRT